MIVEIKADDISVLYEGPFEEKYCLNKHEVLKLLMEAFFNKLDEIRIPQKVEDAVIMVTITKNEKS